MSSPFQDPSAPRHIQETLSLLAAALESTADGILVVDRNGKVTLYNRQFLDLWHIPESLAARNDDNQLIQYVLDQLVDPGEFQEGISRLYGHPDEESNDTLQFKDGRVFRRFSKPQKLGPEIVGRVWSFRDITRRARTEQLLADAKERYEMVVAASQQIVYDYNYQTEVIVWVGSLHEVLGYTTEEMGDVSLWEDRIHPDDRERTLRTIEECRLAHQRFAAEYRFLNKVGVYRHFSDRGFFIFDNEGKAIRMLGMMSDVTERKKTELKILEQNTRLGSIAQNLMRKNEQLEEFTQIVSHNLRSPVGNIATLIDLLAGETDPGESRRITEFLRESCRSLLLTLTELNEVLKVKQSTSIEKQEVRFRDVFVRVKNMFQSKIARLGASVTGNFSRLEVLEYPHIYVESILLNLLSNALKYHHPKRRPDVVFRTYSLDKDPYLEVKDNGRGLDLEKYGHQVFKMRKTFHDHPDGRGIGLFMIKNQVEAMGGDITVQSRVGEGTTFTVRFTKAHP